MENLAPGAQDEEEVAQLALQVLLRRFLFV